MPNGFKKLRQVLLVTACSLIAICFVLYYFDNSPFNFGLPSDEKVIETLQKHRSELETARHTYITSNSPLISEDKIPALKRAGIKHVITGFNFAPNYLIQGVKAARDKHALRYTIAEIEFSDPRLTYPRTSKVFTEIATKSLINFPIPPVVENDNLVWKELGEKQKSRYLVLNNLDIDPAKDIKRLSCAYRQIETEWFIELCNNGRGG